MLQNRPLAINPHVNQGSFRSMKKTLLSIGLLALFALGIFVGRRTGEAPAESTPASKAGTASSANSDRPLGGAEARGAEKRVSALPAPVSASATGPAHVPSQSAESRGESSTRPSAARQETRKPVASSAPANEKTNHHEPSNARRSIAQQVQAQLQSQYARFFEMNGLDPVAKEKVLGILVEERNGFIDGILAKKAITTDEQVALFRDSTASAETRLSKVLSPAQMASMNEYRRELPYRPVAEDTAARCAASGIPLAPETVDVLTGYLEKSNIPMPRSGRVYSADQYSKLTSMDGRAVAQAEKILSPSQLALFRESLAARVKRQ